MNPFEVATEVGEILASYERTHRETAKKLIDLGVYLFCAQCEFAATPTENDLAVYPVAGWPMHCGETMEIRR